MSLAGFNGGGSQAAMHIKCDDASGFSTTVTAAATPQVLKNALFAQSVDNTLGGLTFDVATGVVTVAKHQGKGRYAVYGTVGDSIGVNAKRHSIQIFAKEAGVTAAAKGAAAVKTEPAAAARGAVGTAIAIVDLSAVSDTVEIRLGVETDGNAVTVRQASLLLIKIGEVP